MFCITLTLSHGVTMRPNKWYWKSKDSIVELSDIDDRYLLSLVSFTMRKDVERYINWHRHLVLGSVTTAAVAHAAMDAAGKNLQFDKSKVQAPSYIDYSNAQTVAFAAGMIAAGQLEEFEWYESHKALKWELDNVWFRPFIFGPISDAVLASAPRFFTGSYPVFSVLFSEAKWRGLIGDEKLTEFYNNCLKGE